MAWFPGAIRKVVARHRTPMASHRGVCNHVAVSEAASLFNYFNQPGNPTSHFYVRRDGTVEQYVDTQFRAPANLEGNASLISIETQGGVRNVDSETWTADQVAALAEIARWTNQVHGIPLVQMANSLPGTRGIGYHRLGIDPWRVSGGERWSQSYGKICPGAGKIAQIPRIISRARELGEGDGTMAWTDAQIASAVANLREAAATLNEVAQILRTHAVRMDNLVNHQLPGIRADVENVRASASLTAARLDYLANSMGPSVRADVHAIRDAVTTTASPAGDPGSDPAGEPGFPTDGTDGSGGRET
jgi:N-acetylmuramoyl-L-alanine amidase